MVPSDGGAFAAKVTLALEGKAAVLFFILAGMTWARMSTDKPAAIYRRASVYCVIGILMHVTVWNTEVLLPLGICLALFQLVRAKPRIGDTLATIGIAATLFVPLMFNVDTAIDVFEQPPAAVNPCDVHSTRQRNIANLEVGIVWVTANTKWIEGIREVTTVTVVEGERPIDNRDVRRHRTNWAKLFANHRPDAWIDHRRIWRPPG